jgi:adenosyl cobinamide kinase/adenosyl cobinamide phosphate guanylyltransferase
MELLLYNRLAAQLLPPGFDTTNRQTQLLLEEFNPSLELPADLLNRTREALTWYERLSNQRWSLRAYQVLALLFTEQVLLEQRQVPAPAEPQRTLAYWMATGAGKTLVMHLNVLQYLAHLETQQLDFDWLELVVTTPGTNLIEQHRRELVPLVAALNEELNQRLVLTVETTQALLQKPKDYFELPADGRTRRLVLVDEGHVGLSGKEEGEFKKLRDRLNSGPSMLLEYSATYYNLPAVVAEEYGRSIVYQYNYARFFRDGYGKDYTFQPVAADEVTPEERLRDNLHACFQALEDKLRAWHLLRALPAAERSRRFPANLPDEPLLAFMGRTVEDRTKAGTDQDDEASDIKQILYFLAALPLAERGRYARTFGGEHPGPLVVSRDPSAADELLLSFGEAEPWGLVNVGNADRFFQGLEHEGLQKRVSVVRPAHLRFVELDSSASPLRVLVGSRKFAEGWNSFRVSVIGLINLGKGKGNKVIQMFGRGVRLRGAYADGKRATLEHIENYAALPDTVDGWQRRVETLLVTSLEKSYLETFVQGIEKEVPPQHTWKVPVSPVALPNAAGTLEPFETYAPRLPVVRLSKRPVGRLRVELQPQPRGAAPHLFFRAEEDDAMALTTLANWQAPLLDYRTSTTQPEINRQVELSQRLDAVHAWLDHASIQRHLLATADAHKVRLYTRQGETLRPTTVLELLPLLSQLYYREVATADVRLLDQLLRRLVTDLVPKLRRRLENNLNQQHYEFALGLQAPTTTTPGDFLAEYAITLTFDSQEAYDQYLERLQQATAAGQPTEEEQRLRQLALLPSPPHVYEPILHDQHRLANEKVGPDIFNAGERKLVRDLYTYVHLHFGKQSRYGFYLLRNVESLRRIGVYLNSDEAVFLPDFVLWVTDTEGPTQLVFLDPKGQRDLLSNATLEYNGKARLGHAADGTLPALAQSLEQATGQAVRLKSFLLLRDSSEFGQDARHNATRLASMLEYGILRLDWHQTNEQGATSLPLPDKRTYLDVVFDSLGLPRAV